MRRRDFLKTLPAAAGVTVALPTAARAARLKITDVRLINIRLIKDMGIVPRRVGAGTAGGLPIKIGGFSFLLRQFRIQPTVPKLKRASSTSSPRP